MTKTLWLKFRLIVVLNLLMLVIHVVNVAFNGQLVQLGIVPRSVSSISSILTAPFIHASSGHLINNLVGLSIFSALCLMRSVRYYLSCSLFIIVFSGGLVWLFGRDASHIGASGWIFGLWSLSIAIAWFDRRLINIIVAVLVLFLYGGMVYGVLPNDPRISFEAHLFGALAGIVCAFLAVVIKKSEL